MGMRFHWIWISLAYWEPKIAGCFAFGEMSDATSWMTANWAVGGTVALAVRVFHAWWATPGGM